MYRNAVIFIVDQENTVNQLLRRYTEEGPIRIMPVLRKTQKKVLNSYGTNICYLCAK